MSTSSRSFSMGLKSEDDADFDTDARVVAYT